jgi:hypothetical protein
VGRGNVPDPQRLAVRQPLGLLNAPAVAAALAAAFAAGMIDRDFPHGLGGRTKEVSPPFPARVLVPHQLHVRFVDQGGRLERLTGGQPAGQDRGQAAQLGINRGQQFRCRMNLRREFGVGIVGHRLVSFGRREAQGWPPRYCSEKNRSPLTITSPHFRIVVEHVFQRVGGDGSAPLPEGTPGNIWPPSTN